MALEDTRVCDSASLEMADLLSLGVLSGLRMEVFLLLREISSWNQVQIMVLHRLWRVFYYIGPSLGQVSTSE